MIRKGVLIIGADKGIGLAISKKFASMNYDIFGTYNLGSPKELDRIGETFPDIRVRSIKLDASSPCEISKVMQEIFSSHPYIQSVIYNSGISLGEKMIMDFSLEEIDKLLSINLKGCILANKEAGRFFTKQKHGNIVNISSIYGIYGGSCESVYSASKSGIIGLTKSLAQELGGQNIRVNAVAPAYIQTDMTASYSEEEKRNITSSIPLGRLGNGQDVANAVYFLASDEASYITGVVLEVSGGVITF